MLDYRASQKNSSAQLLILLDFQTRNVLEFRDVYFGFGHDGLLLLLLIEVDSLLLSQLRRSSTKPVRDLTGLLAGRLVLVLSLRLVGPLVRIDLQRLLLVLGVLRLLITARELLLPARLAACIVLGLSWVLELELIRERSSVPLLTERLLSRN